MYSFEFLKVHPDKSFIMSGLPASQAYSRGMSEPGRQYALYIHHSSERRGSYVVSPGNYHESLMLKLPPGNYQADWVDTEMGSVVKSESFTQGTENKVLTSPTYKIDIALRIKRN